MKAKVALALLLQSAVAHAEEPPPPPAAMQRALPESLVLPSVKAREPTAETDAIKVRIDGEYEVRQSFLTNLPLASVGGAPPELGQTSRFFHWLRLRGLSLFGKRAELRAEADVPRGMIYGVEPEAIPDTGTDFERLQPVRVQPRLLRATLRGDVGEVSIGHTTAHLGLGLLDNDGDQPRYFGTPDRPATFERISLRSGGPDATLRVGLDGDLVFDDGRVALSEGDTSYRVGLSAQYAPSRAAKLTLLTRYQALRKRDDRGGAQLFDFDLSGALRQRLRGKSAELFCEYEGVYRVGSVAEPTAYGLGDEQAVLALGLAARAGVALERVENHERYAHFVASLEWGFSSGDADPTDDEVHRFVMDGNHGVGLILFSEVLRFKTSRSQAAIDAQSRARVLGLATRGGVAGASYVNPVVLVRPLPDLLLKLGGVVATATSSVVDPGALAMQGKRQNFDGGSPIGRSLGTELDVGAELTVHLDPPMQVRFSIEGAVASPGSAFDDENGHGLGPQALTTVGLGLTF